MKVNYFQVDDSFHVLTYQVSDSVPLYFYSEPSGGIQLLAKNPSTQGRTEAIFDHDHVPAFVLNNGIVSHLNEKLFKLSNLNISVDSGTVTISFNAATYGSSSDITYDVIRSVTNNTESGVGTLACLGSNTEEILSLQDSYDISGINDIQYFLRVKDSIGDILYESLPVTISNSAARGIITNDALQQELNVFPSPVSSELTVSGIQNKVDQPYMIYDCSGKIMMRCLVTQEAFKIDVSFLPDGIYWLKCGSNTVSFKKE